MPEGHVVGMATFIPEWTRVSGRNLHVKRVLNRLGDACMVRRSMNPREWTPDFFIQHPDRRWLAIAVSDVPFSALDPEQLFETEGRAAFEQLMARFSDLDAGLDPASHRLGKWMLMWSCSPEEARTLSSHYQSRGVALMSKEQFLRLDGELIPASLAPLDEESAESLLGRFFPEAEIPAACTTRRTFNRDNLAKLTRFFLDCQQEGASKLDLDPPREQAEASKDFSLRLVNGVAGSGKTLIALNRALLLAATFPKQRILVLIHNTPIVADIKNRLHHAYGGIPKNLKITTFFAWVVQQWTRIFRAPPRMPENPYQVLDLIKLYRVRWPDLKPTNAQLLDELDFINDSLVVSEDQYLAANRAGQGFALRPTERSQVWALYERVTKALTRERRRMWSATPRDICLAGEHQRLEKYRHILVDEAQFFAPSWFQVVKLSLEPDGHLFLCADPNQGFMKSRLSWKSVGLDVSGRTKKLRKSYRMTQAILKAASHILAQSAPSDPEEFLEPDFAGMEAGAPPILIYSDSPQDAIDRVTNEVAAIAEQEQLPMSSLLVIHGNKVDAFTLFQKLGNRIGPDRIWWMNGKEHKKAPPKGYGQDYLRLARLETATGLEATVVFLVGIEDLLSDADLPGLRDDEQARRREGNARKLFMAMTRAGQRLALISSQRAPEAIERVFEQRP